MHHGISGLIYGLGVRGDALNYPQDFDTPAFPAGRSLAINRFMAIGIAAMAFAVMVMCGLVWWVGQSRRIDPFLVSINPVTGMWNNVGHSHGENTVDINRAMQESVAGQFVENWFTISEMAQLNNARWQPCRRDEITDTNDTEYADNTYAISCRASQELYSHFVRDVMPEYTQRVENGERWVLDRARIQIEPVSVPTVKTGMFSAPVETFEHGATWRMWTVIQSNISGDMNVVAFIKINRDVARYPETMGFFVTEFNAYKLN